MPTKDEDLLLETLSAEEEQYAKDSGAEPAKPESKETEVVEKVEEKAEEKKEEKVEKIETEVKKEDTTSKTEVKKEEKKEETKVDVKDKKVPLAALQEAREKNKKLNDRVKAAEEFNTKAQERLTKLMQKLAEPDVKPEDNIEAALLQKTEKIEAREQVQAVRQTQQQETQRTVQEVEQAVLEEEKHYKEIAPDYEDAITFLRNGRAAEYKILYPGITDAQIGQALYNEAIQIANQAIQDGRSPAEAFHQLAKSRGFVVKQTIVEDPKAAAAKKAEDQLKTIQKGQYTVKKVKGSESGTSVNELTLEAITNMSDTDFDKLTLEQIKSMGLMA